MIFLDQADFLPTTWAPANKAKVFTPDAVYSTSTLLVIVTEFLIILTEHNTLLFLEQYNVQMIMNTLWILMSILIKSSLLLT